MATLRILHCLAHGGGAGERLTATLIASLGSRAEHTAVFARPADTQTDLSACGARIDRGFPSLTGKPTPGRLMQLAQAMAQYDLVLTHDYGALGMALAHTAFGASHGLPPLIHHEYGFGEDGEAKPGWRRNWYRRIALGRAAALVVAGEHCEGLALTAWQQPIGRVRRIAPGVRLERYARAPRPDALRGLIKHDGEHWIGAIGAIGASGALQGGGDFDLVVRALRGLPESWHLVLAGDGPAPGRIREAAMKLELSHRVHLPGRIEDEPALLGLLDIFVHAGKEESYPYHAACAMAAGLPIAAHAGTDLVSMASSENAPFLVGPGKSVHQLQEALERLADDPGLRLHIGRKNRERAQGDFAEGVMVKSFRRLYSGVLGQEI